MAWLIYDFDVPSLRLDCFLLALACEEYKAMRAALAACFSALLASDRADLDFLPIVIVAFQELLDEASAGFGLHQLRFIGGDFAFP